MILNSKCDALKARKTYVRNKVSVSLMLFVMWKTLSIKNVFLAFRYIYFAPKIVFTNLFKTKKKTKNTKMR